MLLLYIFWQKPHPCLLVLQSEDWHSFLVCFKETSLPLSFDVFVGARGLSMIAIIFPCHQIGISVVFAYVRSHTPVPALGKDKNEQPHVGP